MKRIKIALIIVLGMSAAYQVGMGLFILIDLEMTFRLFDLEFSNSFSLFFLSTLFGLTLIKLGILSALTAWWIEQEEALALPLAYFLGLSLLIIGMAGAALTGKLDSLFVDASRGGLILFLAGLLHWRRAKGNLLPGMAR